jgi:hypothetical protein
MMQSKLKSLDDFETRKSKTCHCVWLLTEIQGITHHFEGTRNVFISLDNAWSNYYGHRQTPGLTLHKHLMDFQGLVQVLEHYGAALGAEGLYQDSVKDKVMAAAPGGLSIEEYQKRATLAAKKKSVAIAFLKLADRKRYDGLWSELENSYTRRQDHYPSDLMGVYNLLLNYKVPPMQPHGRREQHAAKDNDMSGLTFLQSGVPVAGTDGTLHACITCYHCQALGHYASKCPLAKSKEEGMQMLQVGPAPHSGTPKVQYQSYFTFLHLAPPGAFTFHQNDNRYDIIPDTWILLDSQSTVSVFKNQTVGPAAVRFACTSTVAPKCQHRWALSQILATFGLTRSHLPTSFPWQLSARSALSPWIRWLRLPCTSIAKMGQS